MANLVIEGNLLNKETPFGAHPGKVCDTLYQNSDLLMKKDKCLIAFNNQKMSIPLTTLAQSYTINLTNTALYGDSYLKMTFPATAANQTLVPLAIVEAIQSLQFQLNNGDKYSLTGKDIFWAAIMSAESNDKKDDMILKAGSGMAPSSGVSQTCYLPLQAFFSSIRADQNDFPFDAQCLNGAIQITVTLNGSSSVCTGSAAASYTSISNFALVPRTGNLRDPSNGMRAYLQKNPSKTYDYNFIAGQSLAPISFTGVASGTAPVLSLQGFLGRELREIDVVVVTDANATLGNYNITESMSNIVLSWNGNTLYQSEDLGSDMDYLMSHTGSNLAKIPTVAQIGSANTTNCRYYNIVLSENSPLVRENFFEPGANFQNGSVLNLSFNSTSGASKAYVFLKYNAFVRCSVNGANFVF